MVAPALAQDRPNDGESYEDFINRVGGSTGLGKAFDSKEGTPLNAVAGKGGAGFNDTATFEGIVGLVITTVMGLLGVIFLVLAVYAGFKWMTAAGNEEAVEKAKSTLTSAIIGLIVVLAAYTISRFVISILGNTVFK
ncbi:MAG: pilin [bacterium]|nr:pilin [bacterium]